MDQSLKANIRYIVTDITLCKEGQKRGVKGKIYQREQSHTGVGIQHYPWN